MATKQSSLSLSPKQARRLALVRSGLLKPAWTGMPGAAAGRGRRPRRIAAKVIGRFGYLQLDTVAIAGARSHTLVLLSRLDRFRPELGEALLAPGEPLFEYWGHEASWIPLELYPSFAFRRHQYRHHPWWGDVIGQHPTEAADLLRRIRDEGPLRSLDLEGRSGTGWDIKLTKKIAAAFWSRGDLAIRERRNFQRVFDLTERVIPEAIRRRSEPLEQAIETLMLRALSGFGWATTGTLAETWRLRNMRPQIDAALMRLVDSGQIVRCDLVTDTIRRTPGWIRPADLELLPEIDRLRPRRDKGILLSPFDPLIWDRRRARLLFDFDQVLEIFKPHAKRRYGYYCLPVLAGERLIGRLDLKAQRARGHLEVLAELFENEHPTAADHRAAHTALTRLADSLELAIRR